MTETLRLDPARALEHELREMKRRLRNLESGSLFRGPQIAITGPLYLRGAVLLDVERQGARRTLVLRHPDHPDQDYVPIASVFE